MWPFTRRAAHRPSTPAGPVTIFGLVWIAVIAVFLMVCASVLIYLLQSDWCSIAIGSAQYINGRPDYAINGCIDLLKLQVQALAPLALVALGILGAVLFVLMVILVARGRASMHGPGGFGVDIGGNGPETPAEGAQIAADAAQGVAADLQEKTP